MQNDMVQNEVFQVNKKYKDRFFCLLFGSAEYREYALSLYNAVNDTEYENADELVLYTLSDAVYMKMKNDVSYLVHNTIALYEQQSTVNPNMPVRGLLYFGEMYSKYISNSSDDLYGSKLIKLPNPQYIVFYNGSAEYAGPEKLKLSDAFYMPDESGEYEWTATVVNINCAENVIRKKCHILDEYMQFVERIRLYVKTMQLEDAVDRAIRECIEYNILKEILLSHRAEVRMLCITEFDEKKHEDGLREEGRAEGRAESLDALMSYISRQNPGWGSEAVRNEAKRILNME